MRRPVSLSRRTLLAAAGATTGAVAARPFQTQADDHNTPFTHSVASGDPLQDRVVLWTRAVPEQGDRITVQWQVSEDQNFRRMVQSGEATTDASRAHTVKVDVRGLEPGQRYFYRFLAGDQTSPTGITRTLPEGPVDEVRFAIFSCSNFGWGFFNAYAHAAQRGDLDFALHLGDYIYEYDNRTYSSPDMVGAGRSVSPDAELLNLDDYRQRYASYRSDPDLQEVHRVLPFIVVWDDHESANDAFRTGAENHNDGEGEWERRLSDATQAYFEWMPIRPLEADAGGRLYRSFELGDLATLAMLDTRIYGRDQPLDYAKDLPLVEVPFDLSDPDHPKPLLSAEDMAGVNPAAVRRIPVPFDMTAQQPQPLLELGFRALTQLTPDNLPEGTMYLPDFDRFKKEVWMDPDRTIMGAEQEAWLETTFARSKAAGKPWQILGQQSLMGRLKVADITPLIDPDQPNFLTPEQMSLIPVLAENDLPIGFDAFGAGYPVERERLLQTALGKANNMVVLAGDSHNSWAFNLTTEDGQVAGVEFGGMSVSSPGFEILPMDPDKASDLLVQANEELEYAKFGVRGYVAITVTPDAVRADYVQVETVAERRADASVGKSLSVARTDGAGTAALTEIS